MARVPPRFRVPSKSSVMKIRSTWLLKLTKIHVRAMDLIPVSSLKDFNFRIRPMALSIECVADHFSNSFRIQHDDNVKINVEHDVW